MKVINTLLFVIAFVAVLSEGQRLGVAAGEPNEAEGSGDESEEKYSGLGFIQVAARGLDYDGEESDAEGSGDERDVPRAPGNGSEEIAKEQNGEVNDESKEQNGELALLQGGAEEPDVEGSGEEKELKGSVEDSEESNAEGSGGESEVQHVE